MNSYGSNLRQRVDAKATLALHKRIVLPHLRRYWKGLLTVAVLMGSLTLIQLPTPLLTRYIIDDVLPAKEFPLLLLVVVALAGIAVTGLIFGVINRYLVTSIRERILKDIELGTVEHAFRLPLWFFDKITSGRLMARIGNDVTGVSGLLGETIVSFLVDVMTLAVGVAIIWVLNWKLALLSLALLPLFAISFLVFNKRLRGTADAMNDCIGRSMSTITESFDGIRLIKSYLLESLRIRRLRKQLDESAATNIRYSTLASLSGAFAGLVGSLAPLIVFLYGGREIMHGNMTLGTLIAFNAYLGYVFGPTQRLFTMQGQVQAAIAALYRMDELQQIPIETAAAANEPARCGVPVDIEFRDVSFGYDSGAPILRHINLCVARGEKIAIIGRSGVGKTTLVHLLLGFYPPTEGSIFLGGTDAATIPLESRRGMITLVSQDTYLFSGTIRENIACGRGEASREEVVAAARLANAHEFIERMPLAYETEVGPRGIRLSGGQRQRVALARALVRNPGILILDEAESEIDNECDSLIQSELARVLEDRTVIGISHRISSLQYADKIIVLQGGEIVAAGTHDSLYSDSADYRRFCHTQIAVGAN